MLLLLYSLFPCPAMPSKLSKNKFYLPLPFHLNTGLTSWVGLQLAIHSSATGELPAPDAPFLWLPCPGVGGRTGSRTVVRTRASWESSCPWGGVLRPHCSLGPPYLECSSQALTYLPPCSSSLCCLLHPPSTDLQWLVHFQRGH